ncbi:sulfatase family protein [Pirellulaceae bacterium SH467]
MEYQPVMARFLRVSVWLFGVMQAISPTFLCGEERPNFVFIYTDDQRWDALGVVQREQGEKGRFPWLESPNLDRLAADGVRFRNAFVVTGLCAPSRAAFLTGRYGHLNGVIDNHTPFPVNSVTHATLMRSAGYKTGYVGKWHMGSQSGQRPGFDFSASFVGQGVYFNCPFEIDGEKHATDGWVDDVSTEYALGFIENNKSRPFSLVIGYKTCHGPFTPPERHQKTYGEANAKVVPNLATPAIYRPVGGKGGGTNQAKVPSDQKVVKTNLGMFRGLRAIDENVGRILEQLDRLGLRDNTVVVYSSDNGYYLGEHGLGDKRSAYEEAMRVPMIVRYPKMVSRGSVRDEMVLNIDLAPTFLELAGLKVPDDMQGKSWKPLFSGTGGATNWRKSFFYNYFFERPFGTPSVTAVRTEYAKLIKYPGHEEWTELFDLSNDPYETKNLVDAPNANALREDLEEEYRKQIDAVQFHVPSYADENIPPAPGRDSPARSKVNRWVLDLDFSNAKSRNEAMVKKSNIAFGTGRDGKEAAILDGEAFIEVPKSSPLDPTLSPFEIEAVVLAENDGTVIAHGGQSLGYTLVIADGKPLFGYRSAAGLKAIRGPDSLIGNWAKITAKLTVEKKLQLFVNGKLEAEVAIEELILKNPNDGMQIGADTGSQVLDQKIGGYQGKIESIRLFMGHR